MSEQPPPTESELVELVRSIDVRAPQELHRRIDAMVAERTVDAQAAAAADAGCGFRLRRRAGARA